MAVYRHTLNLSVKGTSTLMKPQWLLKCMPYRHVLKNMVMLSPQYHLLYGIELTRTELLPQMHCVVLVSKAGA